MSTSPHFQAISPKSSLYSRLHEDPPFVILLRAIFPYGNGIFAFFQEEPRRFTELLERAIKRHRGTFGSESEARQRNAEFRMELERTLSQYPGVQSRSTILEGSLLEIEDRLTRELVKNRPDAADFASKLLGGDREIGSESLRLMDGTVGLASLELVREGARFLSQVEPEALFGDDDGDEGWCLTDFRNWQDLYMEADRDSEEILIAGS